MQVEWAQAQGTEESFGIQACIIAVAFVIVLILQNYGEEVEDLE
jgi:hypothetical protein